ncbi:MAG: glutathione peroxidase [Saccharospirillaceae bacterium]|nr:glutathione peroxidase [Pseudomonadales bacterium]NRB80640.1 glutathione peroxidase [Saccharospirillaceae bacterium]
MSQFHEFKINSLQGKELDFNNYNGKVVLAVNTASQCKLTPQYDELQKLHKKYVDQGLVIIAFPCNQFGAQEPGEEKDIEQGCLINYGVDFTVTQKIEVNGKNSHPIFEYLKVELPGFLGNKIKWNFTKFLIGKDGQPIKRFAPTTKPLAFEQHIQKALGI